MAIFNVSTEAELSQAITDSRNNGMSDTINIMGDITLTGLLPHIEEDVGLTIEGDNNVIDGNNQHRLFFVLDGKVNFNELIFRNGRAQGGNGVSGAAGMGGALFIYDGTITATNSTFENNSAIGGDADCIIKIDSALSSGSLVGGNANFITPIPANDGDDGKDGSEDGEDGDFGGNGGDGSSFGDGGDGGFGGNGGNGGFIDFCGGRRCGFGGGGSSGNGGFGGFGGGGGIGNGGGGGCFGGGDGSDNFGGRGAGMGSAIFIRSGTLEISNSSFNSNIAFGGTGYNSGQGLGGAIFALHRLTNTNGNNQGMPDALPTVLFRNNLEFSGNIAGNVNGNTIDLNNMDGVEPGIASRPSLEEPDLRFSPHPATGY